MTSKHPPHSRFYRNLQNLKQENASHIFGLKHATSALSISDTRSRLSSHSDELTICQHPSPQPNQTPHATEQHFAHTRNATLDTISSSQSQSHPRPSLNSLPISPTPPPPTTTANNPTTPLLNLATHTQAQSTQARHLFTRTSHLLSPTEREWVESTISDTENATREILHLTESFRVDQMVNNGRVGVKSQLRWFVRDSRRAKEKRERLVLCHASLMGVLGRLQGLSLHKSGGGQRGSVQGGRLPVGLLQAGTQTTEYESEEGTVIFPISPSATTYVSGCGSGSDTRQRPNSPTWDLSVQLQDAGMEVVVPGSEPNHQPEPQPELLSARARDPIKSAHSSIVKLPVQDQEAVSTTLDNELLDMLSWRWNQGRETQ
ncbi:hypothetical protein BDV12DRAFT_207714 [Aspergillus spectabilis]